VFVRKICLGKLNDFHAVELLLHHVDREITKEEINREDSSEPIHTLLQKEPSITACRNLPHYLIEFAQKLSKHKWHEIHVQKVEMDELKAKKGHHKAQ